MPSANHQSSIFNQNFSVPQYLCGEIDLVIPVRDNPSGATFSVRVQPRARKNAITGVAGDALKLALTAPPVEGKANQACIEFLADFLNVPRASVTIVAGQSGRNKVIRIASRTAAQVAERFRAVIG